MTIVGHFLTDQQTNFLTKSLPINKGLTNFANSVYFQHYVEILLFKAFFDNLLTNQQTDRPRDLLLEAPSQCLKMGYHMEVIRKSKQSKNNKSRSAVMDILTQSKSLAGSELNPATELIISGSTMCILEEPSLKFNSL